MPSLSTPFTTEADEQAQSGSTGTNPGSSSSGTTASQQPQQIATGGVGGGSASGAPAGATPAANAGTSASQPAGTNSGSYTNLTKYINANKDFDADQGGLAGKISNNIAQQSGQAQQNIQNASNAFNTQSNQNIAGAVSNQNDYSSALSNPYAYSQNANNLSGLAQAQNASYTGPQSLSDLGGSNSYNNLNNQVSDLSNKTNQAASESGRYALLSSMFGNNNYTAGQQNLDNLLLQSNPNQLASLDATRQYGSQAQQSLSQAGTNAQNTAAANTALANNISNTTNNAINSAILNYNSALNTNMQNQQAQANSLVSNLSQNTLSPEQAAALGLTNGENLYGVNLGSSAYTNPNYVNTASIANTASQNDYNNYNALWQFANQAANQTPYSNTQQTLSGQYNSANAFNPNNAVNDSALNAAIANAKNSFYGALSTNQLNDRLLPGSNGAGVIGNLNVSGQPGSATAADVYSGLLNGTINPNSVSVSSTGLSQSPFQGMTNQQALNALLAAYGLTGDTNTVNVVPDGMGLPNTVSAPAGAMIR